jgi:hypothetical protein
LASAVKKTLQAQERDDETRQQWLDKVLKLAGDKFVFFDETAGWLGMTRLYARSQGGGRIYKPNWIGWEDYARAQLLLRKGLTLTCLKLPLCHLGPCKRVHP